MVRRLPSSQEHARQAGAAYTWHNIEEEEGAADRAVAISGQQHIPVVLYGDGSFQVEPSAVDIKNKLQELGELTD